MVAVDIKHRVALRVFEFCHCNQSLKGAAFVYFLCLHSNEVTPNHKLQAERRLTIDCWHLADVGAASGCNCYSE